MCLKLPTADDYLKAVALVKAGGEDPFRGCNYRMVKATNSMATNDWEWAWAPPYQTIVGVHEEELRNRVTPRPYEEYMLGLTRFLGKAADDGTITPQELVATFNAGWNYMTTAMKSEAALLINDFKAAELADAQTWKTIGQIAEGLAVVATAALVAAAASRPDYSAAPPGTVVCRARLIDDRVRGGRLVDDSVRIDCY